MSLFQTAKIALSTSTMLPHFGICSFARIRLPPCSKSSLPSSANVCALPTCIYQRAQKRGLGLRENPVKTEAWCGLGSRAEEWQKRVAQFGGLLHGLLHITFCSFSTCRKLLKNIENMGCPFEVLNSDSVGPGSSPGSPAIFINKINILRVVRNYFRPNLALHTGCT